MAYTNNVPQANQQIAATQPTIQANFDYIQKAVGQEHNFVANDTDPTHTYHLKASMPNSALSPAIPAGCAGVYFVNNGIPYFYEGTTNYQLNQFVATLKGTVTTPNSSSNFTITTVPANTFGLIYLYSASIPVVQSGQYVSDASKVYGFSNLAVTDSASPPLYPPTPIQLINSPGTAGLAVRAFASSSSYQNKTLTYIIFYRNA